MERRLVALETSNNTTPQTDEVFLAVQGLNKEVEKVNERTQRLETEFRTAQELEFSQRAQVERRKREDKEQSQRVQEENIRDLSAKEEKIKPHIVPETDEEENSLFSIINSLKKIRLHHEETIKNLNEEAEKSTEIIKKMMKVIGIKTDDFSDCTRNIFANKCLERLNDELGNI